MQKVALSILIAVAIMGCSKKPTQVLDISATKTISPVGFIYALPKTGFEVTVESQCVQYLPGPYAQFAEKYLGIKNIKGEPKSEWQIEKLIVKSFLEADMQQLYVVESTSGNQLNFIELNKNGLIVPLRNIHFSKDDELNSNSREQNGLTLYTDLSHTPFIASERTTHISRVFQDSAFVRVPVQKTIIVEKSIEDKAKEAADFIFSLRKRRLDLLSGDADFVAEGKAVEAVLKEINRLENEYVSLFIGKSQSYSVSNVFTYMPTSEASNSIILFRFSTTKGVLPVSDLSGSPVLISATIDEQWLNTDVFSAIAAEKSKPRPDALYYRIPVPVIVRITFGPNELFSKRETALQFGPLVRIPAKYIQ